MAEILRLYSCLDPADKSTTKYSLKCKKKTLQGPWRASRKRSGSAPGQQAAERYVSLICLEYLCICICLFTDICMQHTCSQYSYIMWTMSSGHVFSDCSWCMARLPKDPTITGHLSVLPSDSTKSLRKPETGQRTTKGIPLEYLSPLSWLTVTSSS